jgi:hypothetical protein
MGYHKTEIAKGVLGEPSKIQEELDELIDADLQGNTILAMCELADIYGALEALAVKRGLTMQDLATMAHATAEAFRDGERGSSPSDDSLYECESCSSKPGSPSLCSRCFAARSVAGENWRGPRRKEEAK